MKKEKISLAERAYDVVEEMIVTLQLEPGEVFSESELSSRIEIGRTPLREALQRLSADRLVRTMPRRGMVVTDIDIKEQLVLLETRRVLDRLIAAKAAKWATQEQCFEFREKAAEIMEAANGGRVTQFMRLDRECDEILETACRNPFAARASVPLHAHCRRFWYYYQNEGDLKGSAQLHAHLMETVASGDEDGAAHSSDRLMNYLEQFTRAALDL